MSYAIGHEAVKGRVELIVALHQEGHEEACERATFALVCEVLLAIAYGVCSSPRECCQELLSIVYPVTGSGDAVN
jgi:hypothetical protein